MVVLAAAILTKTGKALLSRQFVEMSRIRIEGLLSAFPKLMGTGKQYTYFETETVRYVYQPIENLFLVLITNRSSNIVEDLETLRLLGRIVPEYCQNMEEETVVKKAFEILFAFDEVIQLGYRENLTLEQVNTFLEMDSHEERLAQAIKQSKITEATTQAAAKARQLSKEKRGSTTDHGYGGISSDSPGLSDLGGRAPITTPTVVEDRSAAASSSASQGGGAKKGMSLGTKRSAKEDLLSKMVKSGELEDHGVIAPQRGGGAGASAGRASPSGPAHLTNVVMENIHLKLEETIAAVLNRDGGFQSLEVKGDMFLTVSDTSGAAVKIHLNKDHNNDYAWKTHPNINKVAFTKDRVLALKDASKPFPTGSSLGILRWRLQNTAGFVLPISVNCWPGDDSVSIEYEVERDDLILNNVRIDIPLGGAYPAVKSIDCGDYKYDTATQTLTWIINRIDPENSQGSMEFGTDRPVDPSSALFPINVSFYGESTLGNVAVADVLSNTTGQSAPYSTEVVLSVEHYEVV